MSSERMPLSERQSGKPTCERPRLIRLTNAETAVLQLHTIPAFGLVCVTPFDCGCCGLDGRFGFFAGGAPLASVALGERSRLPPTAGTTLLGPFCALCCWPDDAPLAFAADGLATDALPVDDGAFFDFSVGTGRAAACTLTDGAAPA